MGRVLRILQIINSLDVGGAELMLLNICRGLKRKGFDVSVCALTGGPLVAEFQRDEIPVWTMGAHKRSPLIIFWLMQLLRRWDGDIVHTHLFHSNLLSRLLPRIKGVRLVATEHNMTDLEKRNIFLRNLYRRSMRRVDLHIAVSESVRALILRHKRYLSGKIVVIPNGIDLKRFLVSDLKKSRRLTLNDSIQIGTVTRLSPEKGVDVLLRAFRRIRQKYPNSYLNIVGTGNQLKALKKLAVSLGIDQQVLWYGFQEDVPEILRTFDCFVLPSSNESFGLSVLEAMASGIPIVATKSGGVPEIVSDGHSGILVKPGCDRALSEGVIRLLADHETRHRMIAEAHKKAKYYSLDKITDQYIDCYRSLF